MKKNCKNRKTKLLEVDGAYGNIQGPLDIVEDEQCSIVRSASDANCENCKYFEEIKNG